LVDLAGQTPYYEDKLTVSVITVNMDDSNPDTKPTPSSQSADNSAVNIPVSTTSPHSNQPSGITPPAPGQVVSAGMTNPQSGQSASAPPSPAPNALSPDSPVESGPPQIVTSQHGGQRRWLKALLLLVVIALLAVGGWLAWQKHNKKNAAPAASQNKEIPLLKIGILQANYGDALYPDMSVNEYSYLTNAQMFEGLVRYEDKSKIVPDLASTWTNPDSKTWLFTVKSGVKFHDGHTLAASDVKYSLDKVIAANTDLAQTFASTIASVETVGTNQVKITTKDADPVLLNRLAFLYIVDANLPKGAEPSQAGTGPYEIKPGSKPTDTSVKMVAFNQYHGGTPTTKALDFGSGDDPTALLKAFNEHKYNIVGPMPLTDVSKAKNASKFVSVEPDTRFLGFNTVKPGPLQKKQVREAIRYAVNPTAIGKAAGNQVTPLNQLIPVSIPGYNPAITPYKQDINKAKQLLAQAGYPNGLTIRFSTSADPGETDEIVKELKQVGITVQVDRHQDFDEFINYFNGGQAEMYTVDYSSDTLDGLDIYGATLGNANYNNPQLASVLSQTNTTTDPAKRLKLLQDAAVIINQDVAAVPLSTQNDVWLMDRNYSIQQDMPSALISVYFSNVQLK
jgi:peptide/nickel transport system substrate-binding protein